MKAAIIYVACIALVNLGFSYVEAIDTPFGRYDPWAIAVGIVFVSRDYAQRAIGHKVWIPMLVGLGLSYLMADPFVALASAAAFAISEAADWTVYTVSKRPLADRVLLSSSISTPFDTLVFLGILGALSPVNVIVQIVSKMVSALLVYGVLKCRTSTS